MKIFTCISFTGFQPTGTSAVVVAENEFRAAELLNDKLAALGLDPEVKSYDMKELQIDCPGVTILCDGDY